MWLSGYTHTMRVENTVEFRDWLDKLEDLGGRARILACRSTRARESWLASQPAHGVSELKVDVGPG